MIDIKLRNVKVEDADLAIKRVSHFMRQYSDRRGMSKGVAYDATILPIKFYIYRTEKTVICVGDYGVADK